MSVEDSAIVGTPSQPALPHNNSASADGHTSHQGLPCTPGLAHDHAAQARLLSVTLTPFPLVAVVKCEDDGFNFFAMLAMQLAGCYDVKSV